MKRITVLGLVAIASFALAAFSASAGYGSCDFEGSHAASATVAKSLTIEEATELATEYVAAMPDATISPLVEFVDYYATEVVADGEVIAWLTIDKATRGIELSRI